jgi:hypothetical protein
VHQQNSPGGCTVRPLGLIIVTGVCASNEVDHGMDTGLCPWIGEELDLNRLLQSKDMVVYCFACSLAPHGVHFWDACMLNGVEHAQRRSHHVLVAYTFQDGNLVSASSDWVANLLVNITDKSHAPHVPHKQSWPLVGLLCLLKPRFLRVPDNRMDHNPYKEHIGSYTQLLL